MEAFMSNIQATGPATPYDVMVLGAGYAGLMTALRLGGRQRGLRVALVSARDQFLERVRLQESIVAPVAPRIPSIAAFLAGTAVEFICGEMRGLDAEARRVRVVIDNHEQELAFAQAVYALGSHIDVENVPGGRCACLSAGLCHGSGAPVCARSDSRRFQMIPIVHFVAKMGRSRGRGVLCHRGSLRLHTGHVPAERAAVASVPCVGLRF